jgi:uncharacterized membrane protein
MILQSILLHNSEEAFVDYFFLYNLPIMEQTGTHPWLRTLTSRWLIVLAVGLLLVVWILLTPDGLLGKADAIGYAVCHRIDLRSFHMGQRALPLCARCSGMYLGALVGLIYQFIVGRQRAGFPGLPVGLLLVIFVGAFALDGANSFLALLFDRGLLYTPSNTLRLITGTGMGLVLAIALYPAFNQTVWRNGRETASISSLKSFLVLTALAAAINILIVLEQPILLYILALLSAGSVLLILTMLYTMVYLMIVRKENCFENLRQLSFALVIGFGVGLLQIGILDLVRFWLTGTWEGFHFG